jgi:SH3-like domain-containing protein
MKTLSLLLILISLNLSAQDFCFINNGLKNSTTVSFEITDNTVQGGEWEQGSYDASTSAEVYAFKGKKVGSKLLITFVRTIPYTLPTQIKEAVWTLEKGILKIPMKEKNHVSNKFENSVATFTKCAPIKSDDYEANIAKNTPCACDAYITDHDPNGLNVREQGNKNAKIVAVIPFQLDGAMVHIVGSNTANWLQISAATDANNKSILKKEGYVFAQKLGISIGGYDKGKVNLYNAPIAKSQVVASIRSELSATILDCKDGWLKIKYENKTGWLRPEAQCANPNSNCN